MKKLAEENQQIQAPPTSIAFIHNFLDEYGLDPYEFRLYAHIVRRTGGKPGGVCFSTIAKIAEICKMSSRKAQQAIKVLKEANFIQQTKRPGRTDEYRVVPASEWVSREELVEVRQRLKDSPQKEADYQILDDIGQDN
jgi:DNA-binding transcriptional regulator GbsR (MarR family)